MRRNLTLRITIALLMTLGMLVVTARVEAGGVVMNCGDDTDFSAKLVGGGSVTFNCGTATITLPTAKTIAVDTTIDGGGVITLSGGNANKLFSVNSSVTLTLKNIVLTDGYSFTDGGAIVNSGHLILNTTTIQNSQTDPARGGGAILTTGPLEITNSHLSGNKAGNGGAIYPRFGNAQVTITDSVLDNNQATNATDGWGGAILLWDGAAVNITGGEIDSNSARYGGAIYNNFANSSMSLHGTEVSNNSAAVGVGGVAGGGIYSGAGMTSLSNVVLSGNMAPSESGGGMFNGGTADLSDVTVSGNSAADGYGGGVFNRGTATLNRVTLSGNTANGVGGGLYNEDGTSELTNVTLSGNSAGSGGGVANSGIMNLTNVTLWGNSAASTLGGGILNYGGAAHLYLSNVIVADSPTGGNCSFVSAPNSSSFNLSSDASCSFGPGRDNVGMMLGPLADNGGTTLTHLPQPGSPAVDGGTNAGCPAADQRGVSRPQGPVCDVGAVEVVSATPTPTPSPTPTPTSSPTPTPTSSPTGTASQTPTLSASPTATAHTQHKQGDLDCDGSVNGADALRPIRAATGLAMTQPGDCPALGSGSPKFGDVNCDGSVNAGDTVAILEYAAGVPIKPRQQAGCTPLGSLLS